MDKGQQLKFAPGPFLKHVRRILASCVAWTLVTAGYSTQLRARSLDFGEGIEEVVVVSALGLRLAVRGAGVELVGHFTERVLEALRHAGGRGNSRGFKHLGELRAGAIPVDLFQ